MTDLLNNFLERTRQAKKVMVLDLGFLGDTIHLLPALWMVRQAYPKAELHVAVASHVVSVMDCVPWVNQVWGYMRYPRHATLRENWRMVRRLRREKFDVVINLNGSDRSSWLTFLSGARERLGRMPDDGGPLFWKRMFTAHVSYPSDREPLYKQRCQCLLQAGFPATPVGFHVSIPLSALDGVDIRQSEAGAYLHISPFTTADHKELPPAQIAGLIAALAQAHPRLKIVLSCGSSPRELAKLKALLPLLHAPPWRVFPGNLNLLQLAAVIRHAALHLCGDTGTLHLAVAAGTPVLAWFWPNPSMKIWLPDQGPCSVVTGSNLPGQPFLTGISTDSLVQMSRNLLAARQTEKMQLP